MAKQSINVGATANDKKGDSLRAAFQKVNANFTELYEAVGLAATGQDTALTFLGSTLSTDDSSSIVIDRATTITSNLSVGGDLLPQTALGGDLGSSALPWRSLYVSNSTIYIGGTAVGIDANGQLTTGGTVVGSTPAWNSITGKPTFATVATSGAYSDLSGRPTIPTLTSQLTNDSNFITTAVLGNGLDVDIKGSVFADDSTMIIDGTDGSVYATKLRTTETKIAIGSQAGTNSQGSLTVAVGSQAGENNQGLQATAVGSGAGNTDQGSGTVAIGTNAGAVNQGLRATAIGSLSGGVNQGEYALALGNFAGGTDQPAYSIMINASGSALNGTEAGLYINPVRNATGTGNILQYNTSTKEITYSSSLDGDLVGSVFADDSTLMVDAVDNKIYATELTVAVGNFVNVNSNNVDVENINGLASQINFTVGGYNNLVIENNLVTIQNVSLSVAGDITLGGNIRSEGNINIDINLADSTLRRWQFGEDGVLNIPGNISQRGSPGLTIESSHNVYIVGDQGDNNRTWTFDGTGGDTTLPNGTVIADDGSDGIEIVMPTTTAQANTFKWRFTDLAFGTSTLSLTPGTLDTNLDDWYFGFNSTKYLGMHGATQSISWFSGGEGGGKVIFGAPAGNNAGDANAIELKATDGDVYITSTESVKITVDAADSSARVWTFDPSGNLNVPGGIVAEYEEDFTITTSYLALGSPPGPSTKTFTFAANGDLTVPRIINGVQDLVISGADNYATRIQAGVDGIIYIGTGGNAPHDIYIGTNTGGKRIVLSNDRLQILATVPASSKGSSGDYAGMVAFNGDYIFYCVNAYDGTTDIWKRVALTGGVW